MTGIINWDELWKATHKRGFAHHGKDMVSHWDARAKEFNKRVMKNKEKSNRQVAMLSLSTDETVLDVGAGTGRLSIPMARLAKSVTALDQSEGMLSCLQENVASEGIKNIHCIQKNWQDVGEGELVQHDVVISSNSLGVYDLRAALAKMDSLAKRAVYIFTFADGKRDDGFRQFMKAGKEERDGGHGRHGRNEIGPAGYLMIYNLLADMGILADIKVMQWHSKEQYKSLDEAVAEWKGMHELPAEKEPELREFLLQKLVKDEEGLCLHRCHKQVLISWQKGEALPA
ncbi:MAG: class I SAM-dependent methyltransferase [Methanothrix sp.]|nr:class I SAM-dependent methyltransferase [Methanothrix sp.]